MTTSTLVCVALHIVICAGTLLGPAAAAATDDSLGESFPACVDVTEVLPYPHSVLNATSESTSIQFTVKFSQPVFIETLDTTYDRNPIKRVAMRGIFLSSDAYNYIRLEPYHLYYSGSGRKGITVKFRYHSNLKKFFRRIYLIVDGGSFYTFQNMGHGILHIVGKTLVASKKTLTYRAYKVYVPLTVIGEYYFTNEDATGTSPVPIPRSPYCSSSPERPLHNPPLRKFVSQNRSLTVTVPVKGHKLIGVMNDNVTSSNQFALQLSITVQGLGASNLSLPATVVAKYKNVSVTVKVPQWSLTLDKKANTVLHIPIEKQPIFEPRERIYVDSRRKLMLVTANNYRIPLPIFTSNTHPGLELVINEHQNHKSWAFELCVKKTGAKLLDFWTVTLDLSHSKPQSCNLPSNINFGGQSLRHIQAICAEGATKTMSVSSTGSAYGLHKLATSRGVRRSKSFPSGNYRQCPGKSYRGQGHSGDILHTIEHGSYYHSVIPHAVDKWYISDSNAFSVTMVGKDGVHKLNESGSSVKTSSLIPPRLIAALEKYVCIMGAKYAKAAEGVGPLTTWWGLERCIFVPKELLLSDGCGGLQLLQNTTAVVTDTDFCNKSFGNCIGLPFSSQHRFPVIPPYGLPELTGWYDYGGNCPPGLCHPLAGALVLNHTRMAARAAYESQRDQDRLIFVLDSIPAEPSLTIPTVEILEPFVQWRAEGGECGSSVSVKPHAIGGSTEAVLLLLVNNTGLGGGVLVFEVKCTPHLTVFPTSGVVRQWTSPASGVTVEFRLDGGLVAGLRRKVHKCESRVRVELAPGLFSPTGKETPVCTSWITTHYGIFQDPCSQQAGAVPYVELKYYHLPESQQDSDMVRKFLGSPAGQSLVFVRAITVTVVVFSHDGSQMLTSQNVSLSELRCSCANADVVLFREDRLLHETLASKHRQSYQPPRPVLSFRTNITTVEKRLYYFTTKQWAKSQDSSAPLPSGCRLEVWGGRHHSLCSEELARILLPLSDADASAQLWEKRGALGALTLLYGIQEYLVGALLVSCIATAGLLFISTAIGHTVLFTRRKILPQKSKIKSLTEELQKAEQKDNKQWESPHAYLQMGPHGPYYVLHSFRCTEDLDSEDLKNLRVAGMLKCKDKQLQVMFGHIKKVFVDRSGENKAILLQASSGMYLLPIENVLPDYQTPLLHFLQRSGVRVDLDTWLPPSSATTTQQSAVAGGKPDKGSKVADSS